MLPFDVIASQGAGVALDDGNRRPQFMVDCGDEDALHLLRLAKVGDVARVGDDALQSPLGSQQWGIGDADPQLHAVAANQIALDIQRFGWPAIGGRLWPA